jgi:hypothetical protein
VTLAAREREGLDIEAEVYTRRAVGENTEKVHVVAPLGLLNASYIKVNESKVPEHK